MVGIELAQLFIVGMPRSGTTLLAALLNAHSRVSFAPETGYFSMVWKPVERAGGFLRWDVVERTLVKWFGRPTLKPLKLKQSGVIDDFHQAFDQGLLTHQYIMASILGSYAAKHQKPIWGEKTPDHFMYVPAIKTEFPEARIISIVRDPRDVHLSLSKVPWSHGNAFNHALQWREYQALSRRYAKMYGSSYAQIRFEDLIANPSASLKTLTGQIGLEFEPEMLNRYKDQDLFDPKLEPWKNRTNSTIDPTNQENWRGQLSLEDLGVFNRVCGRYLKQMGYALPGEAHFSTRSALHGLDRESVMWWARTLWRVQRNRDPWMDRPFLPPESDGPPRR
jgi:hypothetical protein